MRGGRSKGNTRKTIKLLLPLSLYKTVIRFPLPPDRTGFAGVPPEAEVSSFSLLSDELEKLLPRTTPSEAHTSA